MEALFEAMNKVLEKHEVLRCIYHEDLGSYKPYVIEGAKLPVCYEDLSAEPDRERLWRRRREELLETAFSLEEEIPVKMQLLKIGEEEYLLFMVMHHIAADGWSVGIIFQEFAQNYEKLCKGRTVEIQKNDMDYMQYASKNRKLLQSEAGEEKLNYWLNSLKDIPDYLDFPADKQRPEVMMNYGDSYIYLFSEETRKEMEQFCKKQGITSFVFLYSVYALLLYRYSGQDNFCIGTPVANRRGLQEEKIVGFFANSLAIHEMIDGTKTFEAYIKEKQQQLTMALRNQEIPFDYIAKHLKLNRSMSHMPVFQYGFVLQNLGNQLQLEGVELEFLELPAQYSKFEMLMSLSLNDNLFEAKIEYATELFNQETIHNFAISYETLLKSCIQETECMLDEITIWEEKENPYGTSVNETLEEYDF